MTWVDWLVTPVALVATAVKVLAPRLSGTLKKTNRPFGFDFATAPVGSSVTLRLGSVWPTRVTVALFVLPSPIGEVSELTSRSKTGRVGGAVGEAGVVAWKP